MFGFEVGFEEGEDAGDSGEDGDAFAADGFDEARGVEAGLEVDFGREDGGDPEAHHLAEDVAEGEGVEEAEGVYDALVTHVGLSGEADGFEAGEDVAVGVDDAFGVAGGAGGEEDLEGRVVGESGDGDGLLFSYRKG